MNLFGIGPLGVDLEARLRGALRREEPPAGFAERVVRQATRLPAPRWAPRLLWAAAALAATLVVTVSIAEQYRRRQAEEAGRKAVAALRIAAEKLDAARAKVLMHNQRRTE
jgi:hypothetical protein